MNDNTSDAFQHARLAGSGAGPDAQVQDSAEDLKAKACRVIELLAKGHFEDAEKMLHPEVRWWVIGQGDMSYRRLRDLSEATEGRLAIRNVKFIAALAEGETVAIEAVGEMAFPDGRPYRNAYSIIVKFKDGLVLEMREYFDTDYALKIFGSDLYE